MPIIYVSLVFFFYVISGKGMRCSCSPINRHHRDRECRAVDVASGKDISKLAEESRVWKLKVDWGKP